MNNYDKDVKPSERIAEIAKTYIYSLPQDALIQGIVTFLDEQHAKKSERCEHLNTGIHGYCYDCRRDIKHKPSPSNEHSLAKMADNLQKFMDKSMDHVDKIVSSEPVRDGDRFPQGCTCGQIVLSNVGSINCPIHSVSKLPQKDVLSVSYIEDVISKSNLWKYQSNRPFAQKDKRHLAQAIHQALVKEE